MRDLIVELPPHRAGLWLLVIAPLLEWQKQVRGNLSGLRYPTELFAYGQLQGYVSLRRRSKNTLEYTKHFGDPWITANFLFRTISSHATANMSATLKHEHLGELKGKSVDGIAQFLGLKYASIKDRLAAPELVENYGAGATDASKFGYVGHGNLNINAD
jgi:hypothetical protein